MPKTQPKNKARSRRKRVVLPVWLRIIFGVFAVGLLLAVNGFAFAASKEQHDAFCASCHTQPESTFYERSIAAAPVDLASDHTPRDTRCIDCHSGIGGTGRLQAELLGAHNALAFYTGTAVQPAVLTRPVGDDRCLKCHASLTSVQSMDNHFHLFLSRWQSVDPNAATCVTCHSTHTTDGDAKNMFLNVPRTRAVCEACHAVLQE